MPERHGDKFLAAIFDTVSALIVVLDSQGRIVRFNRACELITGYTFKEVKGRLFKDIFLLPEEAPFVMDLFERLCTGEVLIQCENQWMTKDGRRRTIAWSNTVLKDRNGQVEFVIGTGQDITEHREAEAALIQSEEKFRALTDSALDPVIMIDDRDHIVHFNRSAEQVFGYGSTEALGQPAHQLLASALDFETYRRGFKKFASTGKGRVIGKTLELTGRRKDGTEFPLELSVSAVKLKQRWHGIGIIREISQRKQIERELCEHRENLEKLVAIRTTELETRNKVLQLEIARRHAMEMKLKANEARYHDFISNSSEGVWLFETDQPVSISLPEDEQIEQFYRFGYLAECNDAYARMNGLQKADEIVGQRLLDALPRTDPRNIEFLRSFIRSAYRLVEQESYDRDPKGNIHCVLNTFVGVIEDSCLVRVWGVQRDITERKQTEEQIASLSQLKLRLLGTGSLSEKLKLITEGVVEVFKADFARIWMIKEADLCEKGCAHATVVEGPDVCRNRIRCLHLVASSGRYTNLDGGHRRVPFGCYKIGRVASGEDTKFISNEVTTDPRVHDHGWARSMGLVSFGGWRLLSAEGQPIGVLAMFSQQAISANEEKLLEDLANTTSQVILTGVMEEKNIQLAAIVESAHEAIIGMRSDGVITSWNKGAEAIYGYGESEIIGQPISLLAHPDRQEDVSKILEKVHQGDHLEHYETVHRKKDIQPIQMSLVVSPIKDTEGWVTGASVIGLDISQHKQAEQDRERLINELQGALASVKTLSGLLPICASCKKIRDDQGYWNHVEGYIEKHSEVVFSHGICPDCIKKIYPDIND